MSCAAVADADDLELSLEPVLDTVHHVRQQRPREPVEGAHIAMVRAPVHREDIGLDPDRDAVRAPAGRACPLGPSTRTVLPSTAIFTPWGTGIGFLPIRDMFVVSYHT